MPKQIQLFVGGHGDGNVLVVLRAEDVMALRPDWDQAGAEYFLRACADHLAVRMLEAGLLELARLVKIGEQLLAQEGGADA